MDQVTVGFTYQVKEGGQTLTGEVISITDSGYRVKWSDGLVTNEVSLDKYLYRNYNE